MNYAPDAVSHYATGIVGAGSEYLSQKGIIRLCGMAGIVFEGTLAKQLVQIQEEAKKGNKDTGRLIGAHNIGESMLLIDNVDCNINITKDYDKDGAMYMCFNATKMRDDSLRNYICQPFAVGSKIRLLEDIGGIPQFKESIHMAPEMKRNAAVKTSGASSMFNFDNVLDNNENNQDNPFNQDSYTLESSEKIQDTLDDIKGMLNAPIEDIICPVRFINESIETFKLPSRW
jgi:hypothetical protein